MKIYNYHPVTFVFIGESVADESPLEPGVFLIPAQATTVKPPTVTPPKQAVWRNNKWKVEQIPVPKEEPVTPGPDLVEPDYQFQDFLNAIIASPLYQKVLQQAVASPMVSVAFTAVMGALILAAATKQPNVGAIQAGFTNLLGAMTLVPEDIAILGILLENFKLTDIITLPGQSPPSN